MRTATLFPLALALALFTVARPFSAAAKPAGRYDDLSAWAEQDIDRFARLRADLLAAKAAPQVVAALNAAEARQRRGAEDLVALVRVHPELHDLPELGLDPVGLKQWQQAHPDAPARRARLPEEAVGICRRQRAAIAKLQGDQAAQAAAIRRYGSEPEVAAALRRLSAALLDNRRRLLRAFS